MFLYFILFQASNISEGVCIMDTEATWHWHRNFLNVGQDMQGTRLTLLYVDANVILRCKKKATYLFRSRKPYIPKYVKLSIPEELHCIHSVQNCWSIFQFWDVPNCSSNLKTQKHKVLSFQKLLRCSGYDRKQRLKIQGHRWKLMPSQFGCEYKYEG